MLRGLAIGGALMLLAGCTGGPMPTPSPSAPTPSGDGVLVIGTLFSTSTPPAAGLTAAVNAAVRDIDAAGGVEGVPVEVLSRDAGTAGDGTAEASFADLVERGADAVVGPSDPDVAALLVPLAAQAGIPLVTPVPVPADLDGVFPLAPSLRDQGAQLRTRIGDGTVAVLRSEAVADLAAGLGEDVTDVVIGTDPAADVQQIVQAQPDAVVIAAPDAGPGTAALVTGLLTSGVPAAALWFTGPALARYPGTDLTGAHGLQTGTPADPALVARIRQEDPGARSLQYAADAFDAAVLVALAATLAGDDGGPSIEASLPAAAADGIPCRSYGECLHVLETQPDVAYAGVGGEGYILYAYDADGSPAPAE